MVEQISTYINNNWVMLLKFGAGGLVVAFLLVLTLKGANGRWRWSKTK
ncbi:MAG: hypothetical protein WC476_07625 [Phycisphaerae bacterium]|jgi:hypothetical protein